MPRLSEIVADERVLQVTLGAVALEVRYRPNAVTLPMLSQIAKMQEAKDEDALLDIVDLLCDFLAGWDLTGDDDRPLVIDQGTIMMLPAKLIITVMQGITADIAAGEEEKKVLSGNSGDGLPTMVRSESAPNGTQSSERQSSFGARRGTS